MPRQSFESGLAPDSFVWGRRFIEPGISGRIVQDERDGGRDRFVAREVEPARCLSGAPLRCISCVAWIVMRGSPDCRNYRCASDRPSRASTIRTGRSRRTGSTCKPWLHASRRDTRRSRIAVSAASDPPLAMHTYRRDRSALSGSFPFIVRARRFDPSSGCTSASMAHGPVPLASPHTMPGRPDARACDTLHRVSTDASALFHQRTVHAHRVESLQAATSREARSNRKKL